MKIKKPLILVFSLLSTFVAAFVGSMATTPAINSWYIYLVKPSFSPPNWLFGPVWTILYALMGISLYLIWREGTKKKNVSYAVSVFFIQLTLNVSWSIVFFGLKNIPGSLIVITSLWFSIAYLISRFNKINKTAGTLLWPYLAWVTFAGILNFSIWILNR